MSYIGQRIREERKSAGLTQEQLARRADINMNIIGSLERGITLDPHLSNVQSIATALGMSVGELLGEPQKGNWRDLMEDE